MKPSIVDVSQLPWRDTPHSGVHWKKLRFDPSTGESVVMLRFAPGSHYGLHRHPQGENYYVLSGTLRDGNRTYGAGSYVYHPPQSQHRPTSDEGCELLVFLPQPIEELEDPT